MLARDKHRSQKPVIKLDSLRKTTTQVSLSCFVKIKLARIFKQRKCLLRIFLHQHLKLSVVHHQTPSLCAHPWESWIHMCITQTTSFLLADPQIVTFVHICTSWFHLLCLFSVPLLELILGRTWPTIFVLFWCRIWLVQSVHHLTFWKNKDVGCMRVFVLKQISYCLTWFTKFYSIGF